MKGFSSAILQALLLTSMLTVTFSVQPAWAWETIYISADGSIWPEGAPITTSDNITYTLTGDIIAEMIWIQRSSIIVDGNGRTLRGLGSGYGFYWSGCWNVTIKNTNIQYSRYGVFAHRSCLSTVVGNNITNNSWYGVYLFVSSNCSVSGTLINAVFDGKA